MKIDDIRLFIHAINYDAAAADAVGANLKKMWRKKKKDELSVVKF